MLAPLGAVIACAALVACSREPSAANDVDLNAAAIRAQDDIANYAAARRTTPAPHSHYRTSTLDPLR
jgi:hypothetical protein